MTMTTQPQDQPRTKWYWTTMKKLQFHAEKMERETGFHIDITKTGTSTYEFSYQGPHGKCGSYAYSNDEALGFLHGLERGIDLMKDKEV